MSEARDPAAEIARLGEAVAVVRREVTADGVVVLEGLEARLDAVCRDIAERARAGSEAFDRDRLAGALRGLIEGLDELATLLGARHRDLIARLEALEALEAQAVKPDEARRPG